MSSDRWSARQREIAELRRVAETGWGATTRMALLYVVARWPAVVLSIYLGSHSTELVRAVGG